MIKNMLLCMTSKQYFDKHNNWLELDFLEGCPSEIMISLNNRLPEYYEKTNHIPDWTFVVLNKNFDFDYSPDTIELLKDTTCVDSENLDNDV